MIKKGEFENIITFGIGGSYEWPKLLQEYTDNYLSKFNYFFISGPDKDEFNTILKPLSGQKNFYIFSSKSLSTDETLLCLKWLGRERNSENSIVITANSKKAVSIGDWNRVMELIEELEIIEREDEFEVDQWSETWDY